VRTALIITTKIIIIIIIIIIITKIIIASGKIHRLCAPNPVYPAAARDRALNDFFPPSGVVVLIETVNTRTLYYICTIIIITKDVERRSFDDLFSYHPRILASPSTLSKYPERKIARKIVLERKVLTRGSDDNHVDSCTNSKRTNYEGTFNKKTSYFITIVKK
jgi:hypothetical protein